MLLHYILNCITLLWLDCWTSIFFVYLFLFVTVLSCKSCCSVSHFWQTQLCIFISYQLWPNFVSSECSTWRRRFFLLSYFSNSSMWTGSFVHLVVEPGAKNFILKTRQSCYSIICWLLSCKYQWKKDKFWIYSSASI